MNRHVLSLFGIIAAAIPLAASTAGQDPIAIDTRRELLVDDYLLDRAEGKAALRLHRPIAREVVLVFDRPWEGNSCGAYCTVFVDGGRCRMYYQACHQILRGEPAAHPAFMCYAESPDGIHWVKPKLGLVEFAGTKDNNIVWTGLGAEGLSPFRDLSNSIPTRFSPIIAPRTFISAFPRDTRSAVGATRCGPCPNWSIVRSDRPRPTARAWP